jgi:hypothetical protein
MAEGAAAEGAAAEGAAAKGAAAEDLTGRELSRMLQRCPVCREDFAGHFYAHFAVTVLGEDRRGRVREFFDACEDRDWEGVRQFQEFDPRRDAVVAYAVRCRAGRIALAIERSPFEGYEADRLIACDVLEEESGQELNGLIAENDWRRMSWT